MVPLPQEVKLQLHQILRLRRKVTLQHHQILCLPRKVTLAPATKSDAATSLFFSLLFFALLLVALLFFALLFFSLRCRSYIGIFSTKLRLIKHDQTVQLNVYCILLI